MRLAKTLNGFLIKKEVKESRQDAKVNFGTDYLPPRNQLLKDQAD